MMADPVHDNGEYWNSSTLVSFATMTTRIGSLNQRPTYPWISDRRFNAIASRRLGRSFAGAEPRKVMFECALEALSDFYGMSGESSPSPVPWSGNIPYFTQAVVNPFSWWESTRDILESITTPMHNDDGDYESSFGHIAARTAGYEMLSLLRDIGAHVEEQRMKQERHNHAMGKLRAQHAAVKQQQAEHTQNHV
jgi:hypothetical protein